MAPAGRKGDVVPVVAGGTPATAQAAGLTLAYIDLIELNEAFAAQVLTVTREWNGTGRKTWACSGRL